ncbi:MAG: UbiA family prenyltransferase [bacterium]
MKSFLEKIENLKISFGYSILMFCFAIFLRTFLENFTNSNNSGMMQGFTDTFIGYPFWYLSIIFGIVIILSIFSGKPISKTIKLVSFGSFIILLPPTIDAIFYQHQIIYNYIIGSWTEITKEYFTLFINTNSMGIGIKIEVILVLTGIFYYIYLQKKNIFKSLLATWLVYTIIFIMMILPNIVYLIADIFSTLPKLSSLSVQNYFFPVDIGKQILISRTYLSDAIFGNVSFGMRHNLFSIIMSQISLLIFTVFAICSAVFHFGLNKVIQIIKNFRWLRIIHYFLLLLLGIIIGQKNINPSSTFSNIYDWFSVLSLFIGLLFAWLFSVWENDEEDKEIDALSNPERPLIKNNFSVDEWKNIKWSFFIASLIFSLLAGYSAFIITLVFIIVYHIYSSNPLRLKRYPGISSLLVGINACLAILLGFFFVSGVQPFNILPVGVLMGILIFYSCAENIKNLKDIKGDAAEGILTIPVIFGESKGKIITWLLVFLGSFAFPFLIFPNNKIFLLVPILGGFSYFFIVKKAYKEKPLMLFYLISFILILFLSL